MWSSVPRDAVTSNLASPCFATAPIFAFGRRAAGRRGRARRADGRVDRCRQAQRDSRRREHADGRAGELRPLTSGRRGGLPVAWSSGSRSDLAGREHARRPERRRSSTAVPPPLSAAVASAARRLPVGSRRALASNAAARRRSSSSGPARVQSSIGSVRAALRAASCAFSRSISSVASSSARPAAFSSSESPSRRRRSAQSLQLGELLLVHRASMPLKGSTLAANRRFLGALEQVAQLGPNRRAEHRRASSPRHRDGRLRHRTAQPRRRRAPRPSPR